RAVPLDTEPLGQRRLELLGDGAHRAGEVAVLPGELDLVEDAEQRLDDVGLALGPLLAGRRLGAPHVPVVLLLEVVQVGVAAGELLAELGDLGLGVGQGAVGRGLVTRLVRRLRTLGRRVGRLTHLARLGVDASLVPDHRLLLLALGRGLGPVLGGGVVSGHLVSSSSTISASTTSSSEEVEAPVAPSPAAPPCAPPWSWVE